MALHPRRRWTVSILIALTALVLLIPLPVRETDKERVIARSAQCLSTQRRVLLDWKYIPFYDAALIAKRNPRWHFLNDTDLNLHVLESLRFRPITVEEYKDVNLFNWNDDALIEATMRDSMNEGGPPLLRFNVYHGTLGAQGYRVRIYRCMLGVFARYECEWVS